jgi:hypothetical protein
VWMLGGFWSLPPSPFFLLSTFSPCFWSLFVEVAYFKREGSWQGSWRSQAAGLRQLGTVGSPISKGRGIREKVDRRWILPTIQACDAIRRIGRTVSGYYYSTRLSLRLTLELGGILAIGSLLASKFKKGIREKVDWKGSLPFYKCATLSGG